MRAICALIVCGCCAAHANTWQEEAVTRAGNGPGDQAVLDNIEPFINSPNSDATLREEARRLCEEVERWMTDPKLDYFGKQVLDAGTYDFGVSKDSILYPLCEYYLARMKVWVTLEYGGLWNDPVKKRERFDEIRPMFERLHARFPESDLIKMYLGEPIPPDRHSYIPPEDPMNMRKSFYVPEGAPAWAVAQREAIERLADIIEWWIDNRMREDGQFGGGWGDDCEMWRWWAPVLVGFADPKISAAQERFSKALLAQPHMKDGYTSHVFDVEHTSEDSSDVLTPMMHLQPANEEWKAKTLRLAELFEHLWTGLNDRGQLQFKSTYFSVDKVDDSAARACDTVYHPRAVQPVLLYWQRTNDPHLTDLFSRWMDTWVDAAAREERGKPAGIIPSAIHWPDGGIGGVGEEWWNPKNHSSDPLYVFPSAMGQMLNTLLQTYAMTGNEKYLAPIRSMAQARLDYLNHPQTGKLEPGSLAWCADRLGSVNTVAAKYKFLTGKTDLDEFLAKDPTPYAAYRMNGDITSLTSALEATAEALRVNFWGYTSEVRYTDRVLRFPSMFGENGMYPQAIPAIKVPDTDLLYSTITGDPGTVQYFPMNAVRWHIAPRGFAAVVKVATSKRFEADVFLFGANGWPEMELFRLDPGKYTLTVSVERDSTKQVVEQNQFEVFGSSTRVRVPINAWGKANTIVVEPVVTGAPL
ncbi:MAG: hypothetical protein AMXMBFR84_24170 [Candidatus Hydrogenedentota bacterium]